MTPTQESESESDFHHFSEIYDSNSNSGKNRFSYCTGIDSRYWNRFQNRISMIPIQIPAKNGIITPLVLMRITYESYQCTALRSAKTTSNEAARSCNKMSKNAIRRRGCAARGIVFLLHVEYRHIGYLL